RPGLRTAFLARTRAGTEPSSGQPHSITSSARASNDAGTVRPIALATLRLITTRNLVGCITGRSAVSPGRGQCLLKVSFVDLAAASSMSGLTPDSGPARGQEQASHAQF